jgi:hypothetical protein
LTNNPKTEVFTFTGSGLLFLIDLIVFLKLMMVVALLMLKIIARALVL